MRLEQVSELKYLSSVFGNQVQMMPSVAGRLQGKLQVPSDL